MRGGDCFKFRQEIRSTVCQGHMRVIESEVGLAKGFQEHLRNKKRKDS